VPAAGRRRRSGLAFRFRLVLPPPGEKSVHALNDLSGPDVQDFGKLNQSPNGGASDTPLNEADVRSVKASFQGQAFLGDLAAFANLSKRLAECLLGAGGGLDVPGFVRFRSRLRQATNADTMQTLCPRTIVRI
jgi:hypothetical protein